MATGLLGKFSSKELFNGYWGTRGCAVAFTEVDDLLF
jgi:hypothetical protein